MNNNETDEWKKFLKPILSPYESDPRVSLYLIGRAARCSFSEREQLHDIDLLIIGENFSEPCSREVTVIKGVSYDISYVRASSLRDMVLSKHAMWIEMLAHSKLLQSLGGVAVDPVEKAAQIWAHGPGRPDTSAIKRIRFECGQLIENLQRHQDEPVQFAYLMSYSLHRAVVLYFELEGLWLPKPKKQMQALKRLSPDLYNQLADCLASEETCGKLNCFTEALTIMLRPYGGVLLGFSKGAYPIDL